MAEQMDPLTGKPRRKRKGDRKPQDPMYPMLPDAPAGQQPPAGVNQMFNPTPQNPATRSVGSRNKMSLGQQLVSAISDPSMQARNNLPPIMGMTDAARARQGAPAPEQRAVTPSRRAPVVSAAPTPEIAAAPETVAAPQPTDAEKLTAFFNNKGPADSSNPDYLALTPEQRTQVNLQARGVPIIERAAINQRRAEREPMQVRPQQPDMDMPPAPQDQRLPMSPSAGIQPDMDMPPAPQTRQQPTNQFGQPIRGVLPPERAPEDPNRVMEEFGRGSPEHIAALQAQMRTQQVARSRPEDMNDPRLAGLPTREQYESDLIRRRYGEEGINERAAELMEDAPLGRTEADAVRMAGREALNQRRRDRGMLDLDQMQDRRDTIRQRGQEMFEQRRARERGERQARRQEMRDRDTAREMGISYGEFQNQQAMLRMEQQKLDDQRDAAERMAQSEETRARTAADAQIEIANRNNEAKEFVAGLTVEQQERAAESVERMKTEEFKVQRERLRQEGVLAENAQLLSQAQTNAELQMRVMEMLQRNMFDPMEMLAIAEQHATNMGLDLEAVALQVMAAYNEAQRFMSDNELDAPQVDIVQRRGQ